MRRIALASSFALMACSGSGMPGTEVEGTATEELTSRTVRVTIDFDHDPSGAAIADGTQVDSVYASKGVTFSSIYCGNTPTCVSASAYARGHGTVGSNSVSIMQTGVSAFDARYGALEARFSTPISHVSIDATAISFLETLGTPTARPYIEAYNSSNQLVGRVYSPITYGTANFTAPQTLTIDATDIVRIRLSSQGIAPWVYADFDNLTFGSTGSPRTELVLTGAPSFSGIPVATSNGNGTFSTTNLVNTSWAGAAATSGALVVGGDFNGDGHLDLVATGPSSWTYMPVALSLGGGSFSNKAFNDSWWASTAAVTGAKLVSGDFDGDGLTDLLLTGPSGWASAPVAFSKGDGTFHTTNLSSPTLAAMAATPGVRILSGDVNGDGRDDLILTGPSSWASVPVAFSNGDGSFTTTNVADGWWPSTAATPGVKIVSGDVDGDGKADLMMTGPTGWASIPVAFSNGDGSFHTTNLACAWFAPTAAVRGVKVVSSDVDGDGKADLVLTGPGSWNSVPVAFSNGDGSFHTTNLVSATWPALAATRGAKLVDQY